MIARLPELYRDTVMLSEIKGWPQHRIAQHGHLTVSGVKSRVQRGRAMLKDMLTACCDIQVSRTGHVVDYDCTTDIRTVCEEK